MKKLFSIHGPLSIDRRHPAEMTQEEFNKYGEHLYSVQDRGCYYGAYGQHGAISDKRRKEASLASKELSRIEFGRGWAYHQNNLVNA